MSDNEVVSRDSNKPNFNPTLRQVEYLIKQAQARLWAGEPECAAWRLADALGHLSEFLKERGDGEVMGITIATGLGYKIQRIGPNEETRVMGKTP